MTPTAPYPNDTLRWVAAEVRFPPADDLGTSVPPLFRDAIHEEFPILEEQTQISIAMGPAGPAAQQMQQHRFVRRDRLMSITVGRDNLTVETTEYPGWSAFREKVLQALTALERTHRPDGITRVGLRYIDEVRLPESPHAVGAWAGWIDDRLVTPFTIDCGEPLVNGTIVLQYGHAPGRVVVFRAAPFLGGRTVQADGPLRMPVQTPDGPYFLLDTDASWASPDRTVPEFVAEEIDGILDHLHDPCKRLFEGAITDRLRDEVMKRPRQEVWGQ